MTRPALLLAASLCALSTARADRSTPADLLAGAISIRSVSAGGGGREPDRILVLASRELSETAPDRPSEVKRKRVIDADELAALLGVLRGLHVERIPDDKLNGWPPGGFWYLEIKDRSGAKRLAYEGDKGSAPYFRVGRDDGDKIWEVWPLPEGKRQPLSMEVKVKNFLADLAGGERDPSKAYKKLDPTAAAIDLKILPSDASTLAVQLTPKKPRVVDVLTLARALDLQFPIAVLENAEHGVWYLGERSTHAALVEWRLAEIEVVLDLPKGTTSGKLAPVNSSELSRIVLRVKR
jgi:hypothetical protein